MIFASSALARTVPQVALSGLLGKSWKRQQFWDDSRPRPRGLKKGTGNSCQCCQDRSNAFMVTPEKGEAGSPSLLCAVATHETPAARRRRSPPPHVPVPGNKAHSSVSMRREAAPAAGKHSHRSNVRGQRGSRTPPVFENHLWPFHRANR